MVQVSFSQPNPFLCFCLFLLLLGSLFLFNTADVFSEERHYWMCFNIFLLPQCHGSAPKANLPAQMVAALLAGGSAMAITTVPTGQTRFGNVRSASDFMYLGMKSSPLYL